MKSLLFQKLLLILVVVLLSVACKQPETVIVKENPTAATAGDTTQQEAKRDTDFQKLGIGEHSPIGSLDPLYANNATEMRALQLIYEGLVRLNSTGEVVPGLAKKWVVSDDSLHYKFTLRPDIFYHDSDVFSTGTGRRLTAEDVKFVFERMAKAEVPPRASHLFMNIKGFDSYFQEQHFVYNPKFRQLKGISGIQVANDTTVIFELISPEPDFLKKLATPLAVIYPKEAVGNSDNPFSAVGTGPFALSEVAGDSIYILSKFDNYYAAHEIELDRVDINITQSEMELFKSISTGDLGLLPQLGPQIMSEVLDKEGKLLPSYNEQYKLLKPGGATQYVLRYNPNSTLPISSARKIAGLIETDSGSYFGKMPDDLVKTQSFVNTVSTNGVSLQEVHSTFSADPFIRTFLGSLSKVLDPKGLSLQMMNVYTPVRNTGLLFTHDYPLIPAVQWESYQKLFSFKVDQVALQRSAIEGLSFNRYPWWIDVRSVSVRENDNLN